MLYLLTYVSIADAGDRTLNAEPPPQSQIVQQRESSRTVEDPSLLRWRQQVDEFSARNERQLDKRVSHTESRLRADDSARRRSPYSESRSRVDEPTRKRVPHTYSRSRADDPTHKRAPHSDSRSRAEEPACKRSPVRERSRRERSRERSPHNRRRLSDRLEEFTNPERPAVTAIVDMSAAPPVARVSNWRDSIPDNPNLMTVIDYGNKSKAQR